MSAMSIERPNPSKNYTKNYNTDRYLEAFPSLKARDVFLLTYLLSLPEKWNINKKIIAKKLKMGVWTIGDSLRNLIKAGIASYQRFGNGTVKWSIKLPDFAIELLEGTQKSTAELPPSTPVIQPQSVYPTLEKPALEKPTVLETNNLSEITKETTIAVNPSELTESISATALPAQLSEPEKKAIVQELNKISETTLKNLVLTALVAAILSGNVKKPVGYANVLVKKALNGTFTSPAAVTKELTPQEKEQQTKQKLVDFFNRNLDKLKRDFVELKKDYIHIQGLGNITRDIFTAHLKTIEVANHV